MTESFEKGRSLHRVGLLAMVGALAILGLGTPAAAAAGPSIIHLAVDGRDPTGTNPSAPLTPEWCSTGTEADPYGTFDYALRCLAPGDTLVVHAGTYHERVRLNAGDGYEVRAGLPDDRILVTGAAGEPRPLIQGLLRLEGADYWTIHGIDVTSDDLLYGDGDALVKMRGGTGWSFESGNVWDGRSYANLRVEYDDRRNVAPSWWRVVGSCVRSTRATHTDAFMDHNMYIAPGADSVAGLIADNVLFDAPNGENIKVGSTIFGANDILIRDNLMTQNILLNEQATRIIIQQNIVGPVAGGKYWYPNVRGFSLKGGGNVAVDNYLYGAATGVLTGADGDTSTHEIAERRTLRSDPHITGTGCNMRSTSTVAQERSITEAFDRSASNARTVLHGDWNGDGSETPGLWDPFTGTFHLALDHGDGPADLRIRFGSRDDKAIVGDWDGDGIDEVGVRRGNDFYLALENKPSPAVRSFSFGSARDKVVSGDWDGDGTDTVGVVRVIDGTVTWFLTNQTVPGPNAEIVFLWGSVGDHLLTGDWDGDGRDGPGVVRGNDWYLDNGFTGGKRADVHFRYGSVTDTVVTGDWDGDGDETVAVVRGLHWFLTDTLTGGNATMVYTLSP
jgi:hypothetical protein